MTRKHTGGGVGSIQAKRDQRKVRLEEHPPGLLVGYGDQLPAGGLNRFDDVGLTTARVFQGTSKRLKRCTLLGGEGQWKREWVATELAHDTTQQLCVLGIVRIVGIGDWFPAFGAAGKQQR